MKKISEIIKNDELLSGIKKDDIEIKISLDAESKDLIDRLFLLLEEHVKYFRANRPQGYDESKKEWIKTFNARHLTKKKISIGMMRIRTDGIERLSITPHEFIVLCEPSSKDIGAPDVEVAYLEACKNSYPTEDKLIWTHDVVRHATHATGYYFLRTESRDQTFHQFEKNYRAACQLFADGAILFQLENENNAQELETRRKQKVMEKGYEEFNNPRKALSFLKNALA